jgi:hypothetical protein
MRAKIHLLLLFMVVILCLAAGPGLALASGYDIRGLWKGKAKGTIFGAEGTVTITQQSGEDIVGQIEGGNIFGRARFSFIGKIRGNYIFGTKDGHTFQGYLFQDGSIRGTFRASDGDSYQVFLQRSYPYWGMPYSGMW